MTNEIGYHVIDVKATGRNIKGIMDSRGLTVKDVSRYLGFSAPQSVYHWLQGKSLPSVDNLYALSKWLSTPMDSIIVGHRRINHSEEDGQLYDRINLYYEKIRNLKVG